MGLYTDTQEKQEKVLHQFILQSPPVPKIAIIIPGVFMVIAWAIPVVALFVLLFSEILPGIGFVALTIGFGLMGFFLFRIISWNTSGTETWSLLEDKFRCEARSKHLKFRTGEIELNNLKIIFEPQEERKMENGAKVILGILRMENGKQVVESNLKVSEERFGEVMRDLNPELDRLIFKNEAINTNQPGDFP